MEYKYKNKDIIGRSMNLLDQYKDFLSKNTIPEDRKYEVTLLINLLLGLIILPSEKYGTILKGKKFDPCKPDDLKIWGIESIKQVSGTAYSNFIKNLGDFVSYLRHALAHVNFDPDSEDGEIKKLIFHCKKRHIENREWITDSEFDVTFNVSNLETFATKLAEPCLKSEKQ